MQKGLNQIVSLLDSKGLLIRIKHFVDPSYEIAEVTDRICKKINGEKAVLFEDTGKAFPVLSNLNDTIEFLTEKVGLLNVSNAIADINLFYNSLKKPRRSIIEEIFKNSNLYKQSRYEPGFVSGRGECQQVVQLEPDLNSLPLLTCWEHDAGRFILNSPTHIQDQSTGRSSIETSNLQVFSKNMAGIDFHNGTKIAKLYGEYKNRGEHMPLAIVLGGTTIYSIVSKLSLFVNSSDYFFAGMLMQKAIKLVKGITIDIDLPSDADIVIEGYIDPQEELIWQGPFGTPSGFYSYPKWVPKFYVTCISHRYDAVFPSTIYSAPSIRPIKKSTFTDQYLTTKIKTTYLPEIEDIHFPLPNTSRSIAIIRINKNYIGQVNKVANFLWGIDEMTPSKVFIFVSEIEDIRNLSFIAQLITEYYNPISDTYFGVGQGDSSNQPSARFGVEGKILIDATCKFEGKDKKRRVKNEFDIEGIAEALTDKDLLIDSFNTRLMKVGIPFLVLSVGNRQGLSIRSLAAKVLRKLDGSVPKFIFFVDKGFLVNEPLLVAWYTIGNVDPIKDCYVMDNDQGEMSCLVIDGTRKVERLESNLHQVPGIVGSSASTISRVTQKWESLGIGELVESPTLMIEETPLYK